MVITEFNSNLLFLHRSTLIENTSIGANTFLRCLMYIVEFVAYKVLNVCLDKLCHSIRPIQHRMSHISIVIFVKVKLYSADFRYIRTCHIHRYGQYFFHHDCMHHNYSHSTYVFHLPHVLATLQQYIDLIHLSRYHAITFTLLHTPKRLLKTTTSLCLPSLDLILNLSSTKGSTIINQLYPAFGRLRPVKWPSHTQKFVQLE